MASPADFWAVREPDQWSDAEIKAMVTASPWAKEAGVRARGGEIGGRGNLPAGPGIGGDERAGPVSAPRDVDASTGNAPAPDVLVRWESAAPVYEACAKGSMERSLFSCYSKLLYLSGFSEKWTAAAKSFYVVSMSNYPKTVLSGRDSEAPEHSAAANAALERLGQRIQAATFLKRKNKKPLSPERVLVLPAGQALLVIVFFPRSETITLADKEVSFESAERGIDIKSKFNLRKMVYKGTLEL